MSQRAQVRAERWAQRNSEGSGVGSEERMLPMRHYGEHPPVATCLKGVCGQSVDDDMTMIMNMIIIMSMYLP